jgi:2-oxoglutarate ferredoxin oxidoreductase subunit beta
VNDGVNPLAMALSAGYTFIARSYAFSGAHLTKTIMRAIEHKGMALVDVLQPCPTYNNLHDKEYFSSPVEINGEKKARWYDIEAQGYNGKVQDPNNAAEILQKKKQAFEMAFHPGPQIPVGVLYQIDLPTYYERLTKSAPILKEHTPVSLPIADSHKKPITDLKDLYAEVIV